MVSVLVLPTSSRGLLMMHIAPGGRLAWPPPEPALPDTGLDEPQPCSNASPPSTKPAAQSLLMSRPCVFLPMVWRIGHVAGGCLTSCARGQVLLGVREPVGWDLLRSSQPTKAFLRGFADWAGRGRLCRSCE